MDKTEVRIGNLVEARSKGHIEYQKPVELGFHYFQCFLNGTLEARPIPLNEDWLLKFGFSKDGYKDGYIAIEFETNMILDFVLTEPFKLWGKQKSYAFELNNHRFKEIEYVHQLQNFFFALTGKELKIKK